MRICRSSSCVDLGVFSVDGKEGGEELVALVSAMMLAVEDFVVEMRPLVLGAVI